MPTQTAAKIVVFSALLFAPLVASCTPSFNIFNSETPADGQTAWQGPTVKILVNHLTCELVNAYETGITNATDPDEAQLWRNLAEDHFVAAVDLNSMEA